MLSTHAAAWVCACTHVPLKLSCEYFRGVESTPTTSQAPCIFSGEVTHKILTHVGTGLLMLIFAPNILSSPSSGNTLIKKWTSPPPIQAFYCLDEDRICGTRTKHTCSCFLPPPPNVHLHNLLQMRKTNDYNRHFSVWGLAIQQYSVWVLSHLWVFFKMKTGQNISVAEKKNSIQIAFSFIFLNCCLIRGSLVNRAFILT